MFITLVLGASFWTNFLDSLCHHEITVYLPPREFRAVCPPPQLRMGFQWLSKSPSLTVRVDPYGGSVSVRRENFYLDDSYRVRQLPTKFMAVRFRHRFASEEHRVQARDFYKELLQATMARDAAKAETITRAAMKLRLENFQRQTGGLAADTLPQEQELCQLQAVS